MGRTHKDLSRIDCNRADNEGQWPGFDVVQSGNLQRIADAAEKIAASSELMAKDRQQLIEERDRYKERYEFFEKRYAGAVRSNRAHRANYTRLKNELARVRSNFDEGVDC